MAESRQKFSDMLNQLTASSIDFYRSIMSDDGLLKLQQTLKKVLNAL